MRKLRLSTRLPLVLTFTLAALELIFAAPVSSFAATTFTTLVSFNGTNGGAPGASLVQGLDGNLYGTTRVGGVSNGGTVFKITPSGTLTTLYSFCSQTKCIDGAAPNAGLVQATNGNFYGTTYGGGANGDGTVFKITSAGTLTTLHSFDGTDGATPYGGLVQATNGNLYGTTYGSSTDCSVGCGTVFKITLSGALTTLHSFHRSDGGNPYGGLVQATNGIFYGTTSYSGANFDGTVFEITSAGTLTTLHNFDYYPDGSGPDDGLVQASDGNLYGTTSGGGAIGLGTVFKITPSGTLTTLYSFCSQTNCTDGSQPVAGLVQGTDGDLYGTTTGGGANGLPYGTVFKITPAGTLTTLHSFDGTGNNPIGALVQDTNGTFYGTTYYGGANGIGTVFSLSVGLGPFVEALPYSGKVGATLDILGTNLTGTSNVSFNGTGATFTVISPSEINATVPAGATTGVVRVTTPGGTLKSNVKFRVTPQISNFTPTNGAVGTVVTITGVSLTQTETVTFGGAKATSFTVDSDIQITATVPSGAKTGKIGVTTPGGTATSATSFTVN